MTAVVFLSFKGSPGVTTTSCLVGATWPETRRVVIAECDPAGGDLAARFALTSMGGWPTFASAVRRAGSLVPLAPHLQQLPGGLDVLVGTRHSTGQPDDRLMSLFLTSAALASGETSELSELSATSESCLAGGSFDVVVDLGRMSPDSTGADALTDRVDAVVVVVRGDAASLMHVADRAPEFIARWGDVAGLVVIGRDRYAVSEIEKIVGIPIIGELPFNPKAAAVATGAQRGDRCLLRSPLTVAAARLAGRLSIHGPSSGQETPLLPEDRWHTSLRPFLANLAHLRRGQSPKVPNPPTPPTPPPVAGDGKESLVDSIQGEARR